MLLCGSGRPQREQWRQKEEWVGSLLPPAGADSEIQTEAGFKEAEQQLKQDKTATMVSNELKNKSGFSIFTPNKKSSKNKHFDEKTKHKFPAEDERSLLTFRSPSLIWQTLRTKRSSTTSAVRFICRLTHLHTRLLPCDTDREIHSAAGQTQSVLADLIVLQFLIQPRFLTSN